MVDEKKGGRKSSVKEKILIESGERPIYKEYEYPDGRLLRLTKDEFDQIAQVFFKPFIQDQKNEQKETSKSGESSSKKI